MEFDPKIHRRRSTRLKDYDYSKCGAYFITICTQHFESRFGEIQKDELYLNEVCKMVEKDWLDMPDKFPFIELDEFIVMPNHFHSIFIICEKNIVGATTRVIPLKKNEDIVKIETKATIKIAPTIFV